MADDNKFLMEKAKLMADSLLARGVPFVCVPYLSPSEACLLMDQAQKSLNKVISKINQEQ